MSTQKDQLKLTNSTSQTQYSDPLYAFHHPFIQPSSRVFYHTDLLIQAQHHASLTSWLPTPRPPAPSTSQLPKPSPAYAWTVHSPYSTSPPTTSSPAAPARRPTMPPLRPTHQIYTGIPNAMASLPCSRRWVTQD